MQKNDGTLAVIYQKRMNTKLKITFVFLLPFLVQLTGKSQIEAIKDLASGAGSAFSDVSGSDLEACCAISECCWDGGFFFIDFLIDHHDEIMDFRSQDPTLFSLEIDASFANAIHYAYGDYYHYINYLPRARGNMGAFAADFRYNILTEYNDDFPDSFKSWELLFLINLMPDDKVKFSIGSGVYYEMFTEKYYNENYFETRIGTFQNKDFLGLDTRVVFDYRSSTYPFFEAGVYYNTRFFSFEHLFAYISLGASYQNYYQAHDIWAARGSIIFNLH